MSSPVRQSSSETSEPLYWDGEDNLGTVTFGVGSFDDTLGRAQAACDGEPQAPRINFASAQQLFSVMTRKRWDIVRVMLGAGPLAIREIARRVGRDVKGVHADVTALLNRGVLDRTREGKVVFPYNPVRVGFTAVRVDLTVDAAA